MLLYFIRKKEKVSLFFLSYGNRVAIPSHTSEASSQNRSDGWEHKPGEENFPLQKAILLFHSCFLLSLKHLEMLWSGAGYCIKITICLIRYSSSAVPSILLQAVTSSSCLGGSYKEFLCKHKLCTRGSSLLKKALLHSSSTEKRTLRVKACCCLWQ